MLARKPNGETASFAAPDPLRRCFQMLKEKTDRRSGAGRSVGAGL